MANPEVVNTMEQQEKAWSPSTNDGLHLLYYAASTMADFPGEQTGSQATIHDNENKEQVEFYNPAVEGNQVSKGKGKVRGSKEKMKPGFCDHCGTTEATTWRCIVSKNPEMGHRCNRCAMHLRNNGFLPLLPSKGVLIKQEHMISQLAAYVQPKKEDSPRISHKRAACTIEANDNSQLDGKIKRSCSKSEGEDMPASAEYSSDGTIPQVHSQTLMMDTQDEGSRALLAARLSHESQSFTIQAYRGEDDKQPTNKREASKRAGNLLAAMKESSHDENSNASRKLSKLKGTKKAKKSRSRQSSNSGQDQQLQPALSAMQEDTHNSGSAQTAGLLSGMQAVGQVAPPPPPSLSLPSPAPTTAQQFAFANAHSLLPMPMIAGAGRHAHHVYIMPSNNMLAAGSHQVQPQFVMPRFYSIMPQAMMNASTGAAQPGMTPMQQMPTMPMMMQPGLGMASGQNISSMSMIPQSGMGMACGQQLPATTMFAQPGMGMALQGYAMQQLQQGQLSTAMSWIGNASS